jgi:ribosomal protein L37AE/L43A
MRYFWKYNAADECWETPHNTYIEFRKINRDGASCPVCKKTTETRDTVIVWSFLEILL